jgi:hypothetical protein
MWGSLSNRVAISFRSKIISTSGLVAAPPLNFASRTKSGNVISNILRSGMVDNVGIAVVIAALSLAVQQLFSLPVLLTAILNFCIVGHRQSTSANVRQSPQCQVNVGRDRKCGSSLSNRVAISFSSKVISTSASPSVILGFGSRHPRHQQRCQEFLRG